MRTHRLSARPPVFGRGHGNAVEALESRCMLAGSVAACSSIVDDARAASIAAAADQARLRITGPRLLFDGGASKMLVTTTTASAASAAPSAVLRGGAQVTEGGTYPVQLSAGGPGSETISHWFIDWGDGTSSTVAGDATSASHVYADGPATRRITATVTNAEGTWPVVVAVPDVPAAIDTSFGLNGFASAQYQHAGRPPIVALPAGQTVVAGKSKETQMGRHWSIHRLTAGGLDDPGFGFQGAVHLTFSDASDGTPSAMLLQPDGKLIVAGSRYVATAPQGLRWTLLRLHPDGQPDLSFAGGGRILNPPNATTASNIHALSLQPDGRLLALGWIDQDYVLARYLSDGSLDSSFGVNGVVNLDAATAMWPKRLRTASLLALQSDGRIIVGGWANPDGPGALAAIRVSPVGTVDPTFGDGGLAVARFKYGAYSASGMAVDGQDRIVLAGPLEASPYTYWGAARLSPDGTVDAAFAEGGYLVPDFPANPIEPIDVRMNADSSFWLGGSAGGRRLAIARITAGGKYDAAFDHDGLWISTHGWNIYRLAQQLDGALVATVGDPDRQQVMRLRWGNGAGVTVSNLPPALSMGASRAVEVGAAFQPAFAAADLGQDEIVNWLIEWGDGTSSNFGELSGSGISAAEHVYTTTGPRTVRVTATDEDGTYLRTFPIVVLDSPAVQNGVLRLPGSSAADAFALAAAPSGDGGIAGRFTISGATFDYPLAGISRILIDGAGGNDSVTMSAALGPAVSFGGAGSYFAFLRDAALVLDSQSLPDGATLMVEVGYGALLHVGASLRLERLSVSYGSVTIAPGGDKVLTVGSLSYYGSAPGNSFDLNDNRMVIDYPAQTLSPLGTWQGSRYSGVLGLLQAGYNGGNWLGDGLRSSAAGSSGLYALAAADASQILGISDTETAEWSGRTVDATAVLIMYTYAGDANLDGLVSGDDYAAIDFAIATPGASGWINGDFNYDGMISGDDYTIIDFNIAAQGPPFVAAVAPSVMGSAWPAVLDLAAGMDVDEDDGDVGHPMILEVMS